MQIISVEIENANSQDAKAFRREVVQRPRLRRVGCIASLNSGFIMVKLAHVKKKRQSERYANQESADNRDPKSPHTEAAPLYKNEDPEHH